MERADRAQAGRTFTKELDFVHRAPPFVFVAVDYRTDLRGVKKITKKSKNVSCEYDRLNG